MKIEKSMGYQPIDVSSQNRGYDIDKKSIIIDSTLSSLGAHIVSIELHKKVIAQIKVNLVK